MSVGAALRRSIFRQGGVKRLHIVGCSRSGTTMLHMAMTAFSGVQFHYEESETIVPLLAERLRALAAYRRAGIGRRDGRFFVTKRAAGWHHPRATERLTALAARENIGVILVVRDPRDVLLSSHDGRGGVADYVDAAHWRRSVEAGYRLTDALADAPTGFLIMRYEDMVAAPATSAARLRESFGLRPKTGSPGFHALAHNVANAGKAFDDYLLEAVGKVRDLDPASVGKWRRQETDPAAPLRSDPEIAALHARFCADHGYDA